MAVGRDYFSQTASGVTSAVLVLPVLALYEIGLLWTRGAGLNGVDFLTIFMLKFFGYQVYLIFNGVLILGFVVGMIYLHRKQGIQGKLVLPLLAESTLYALLMGSAILFVLRHALPMAASDSFESYVPAVSQSGSNPVLVSIVVSLGAGINEELFFRLFLFGGLLWMGLNTFKLSRNQSILVAMMISSILFSLAHYLGPESFQLFSFLYRTLAGIVFAMLFLYRGFAVAVYTHAIYDIYVLVLR